MQQKYSHQNNPSEFLQTSLLFPTTLNKFMIDVGQACILNSSPEKGHPLNQDTQFISEFWFDNLVVQHWYVPKIERPLHFLQAVKDNS